MKVFAREFVWLVIATIFAVVIGFFFGYWLELNPESKPPNSLEKVLEMELFLIGAIFGFICTYVARIFAWAIRKQLIED